jgi:hypothetical protein
MHEPLQLSINQEIAMRRTVTFPLKGVLLPEPASLCLVGILGLAAPLRRKLGRLMIRKLLSSLPVVLLFAPLSFGLAIPNTGTAVCNGGKVSLDYTINFGGGSPFTVDVLSIAGATIDSVTCSGGAAIYALSGSQFTVTFGPPIIGTDTTTYTDAGVTISFPLGGGLTNYLTLFHFTDDTSGVTFGPSLLAVATNSTSVIGNFALSGNNITFDPPSNELFIYADRANQPSGIPEPETWVLVSTAFGGMAVLRRKFAV